MEYINALRAGTQLQEYQIREVLGQGGFGITYLADDTNLAKPVALKEYLPRDFATRTTGSTVVPNSDADKKDYRWGLERFLDEARTLARFDHPHLNKVHRFFEANGTAYLVLEYIDGQTISHLLTKYPTVPDTHLQRIIHEVLSGLEEVHAAGYVHRDIKPSNIMLRGDGSAVLLDFGAARQAVGQRSKSITSILTPGYAPIEQYDTKAEDVGPWSDLYALGMVAYRCVSGARDADLPDAVTRARAQRRGNQDLAPAVEVGRGDYDAAFLRAIDSAIQVYEEERPQTIAAWRETLEFPSSDFADTPAEPSPTGSDDTGRRDLVSDLRDLMSKGRRDAVSKVALAVLGMAVLGTGVWMMSPSSESVVNPTPVVQPEPPESVVNRAPVVQPGLMTGDAVADWALAQEPDTPEAYRQFIARHPSSPLTRLAKMKLGERPRTSRVQPSRPPDLMSGDAVADWALAQKTDTPEAYRQFITRHPSGPLTRLAEAKLAAAD